MTTALRSWSTTAASNNSAAPDGMPEGMAPSGVNDWGRKAMATIRSWYEDAGWIDFGDTPTRTSDTQFTVAGDLTARYHVGRPVKIIGATTASGIITASAYTTLTTVTVSWRSAATTPTTPTSVEVFTLGVPGVASHAAGIALSWLDVNELHTAGKATEMVTLTDGATITIDASLSNVFTVTLGGNRTFAAPTNPSSGQVINVIIRQDGTGSRTATWNAAFTWPGGTDFTLSTAASAVDMISMQYDSVAAVWRCVGNQAFA